MPKRFLPTHPVINKRVTTNSFSINQSFSTQEPSVDEGKIIEELIQQQKKIIEDLTNALNSLRSKNNLLKESLQFSNPQKQIKEIQREIDLVKQQQEEYNQKIKDCETVEKNTTVEQYYLWQRKQIIQENQRSFNAFTFHIRSEKDHLGEELSKMAEEREQIQNQIKQLSSQMNELLNQKFDEHVEQESKVTQVKLQKLQQEYNQLLQTTKLLRENREILAHQLFDNMDQREQSLSSFFQVQKSNLLKELIEIRRRLNDSQISPPTSEQQQFKVEPLISEYEKHLEEIKNNLSLELQQKSSNILKPMDWESVKWRSYMPKKQESDVNFYEQYKNVEKQYYENEKYIELYQQKLNGIIEQTVIYRKKQKQIESATHKILNLGMSLTK